ncbi:hypothetical protein ACFXTN_042319 [Malus domestica]
MTCMVELPLESALKNKDSEYFLGLSSLGALSKARVITGSYLGCFCSFSRIDVGVEEEAARALALLRVMMPEMVPPAARMLLFFALVVEQLEPSLMPLILEVCSNFLNGERDER